MQKVDFFYGITEERLSTYPEHLQNFFEPVMDGLFKPKESNFFQIRDSPDRLEISRQITAEAYDISINDLLMYKRTVTTKVEQYQIE